MHVYVLVYVYTHFMIKINSYVPFCEAEFHMACVDRWLVKHQPCCPICKQDIRTGRKIVPKTSTSDGDTERSSLLLTNIPRPSRSSGENIIILFIWFVVECKYNALFGMNVFALNRVYFVVYECA